MNNLTKGFTWKLLERFGVQGIQFILQIVLARLLDPAHYGVLSLMLIFTNLANIFVQSGLNTALIQNKDVTDEDYSSVFWVSLGISCILYSVIFLFAPLISDFYKMPSLIAPLRVLALVLIPGAFNSVQLAKVSRELDFKKVFYSNIGGIIVGGLSGVVLAYVGVGVWALVAQNLINTTVACIVMYHTINWKPRFVVNWQRIKVLFSYGWKLLVSKLLDTLSADLQNLIIGRKYDESTLGYCNRGQQFPSFAITAINSTIQSVLLPAMSEKQDDRDQVKHMTRLSINLSSYVIFPIMAGLAAVSTPLIDLILGEKWLPCVPYMMIYCLSYAFWPVHTSNLQAISAMGRSDIFLKLEVIKKSVGLFFLIIAVMCFDSPIVIAMTSLMTMPIGIFVNAYPNKKLIGYSYLEQMKDILPSFLAAFSMFGLVWMVGKMEINNLALLALQIAVGVVYYIMVSVIFKLAPFKYILNMTQPMLERMRIK